MISLRDAVKCVEAGACKKALRSLILYQGSNNYGTPTASAPALVFIICLLVLR